MKGRRETEGRKRGRKETHRQSKDMKKDQVGKKGKKGGNHDTRTEYDMAPPLWHVSHPCHSFHVGSRRMESG